MAGVSAQLARLEATVARLEAAVLPRLDALEAAVASLREHAGLPPAPAPAPAPAPRRRASSAWARCTDPDTGNVFYYNADLDQSEWTLPEEEEVAAAPPPAETETETQTRRRRSSSLKPLARSLLGEEPPPPAPQDNETDWEVFQDEDTHHPFYFNRVTNESTWLVPEEYAAFLERQRERREADADRCFETLRSSMAAMQRHEAEREAEARRARAQARFRSAAKRVIFVNRMGGAAPPAARSEAEQAAAALVLQRSFRGLLGRRAARAQRKKARHRTLVAHELLDTERSYGDSLRTLVDVAVKPLQQNAARGDKGAILTGDVVAAVFGNVEELLAVSDGFAAALEALLADWSPARTALGAAVQELVPRLDAYGQYYAGYERAIGLLAMLPEQAPRWPMFLEVCEAHPDFRSKSLQSLLIMPIQRLPRYVLLLKELVKFTWPEHPDGPALQQALADMQAAVMRMNADMQEQSPGASQAEVQAQRYFGAFVQVFAPGRQFIHHGQLSAVDSGAMSRLECYLFSDMLILGEQTDEGEEDVMYRAHVVFDARFVALPLADGARVQHALRLLHPSGAVITLVARSADERATWLRAVDQLLAVLRDKDDAAAAAAGASTQPRASRGSSFVANVPAFERGGFMHTLYTVQITRGSTGWPPQKKAFGAFKELDAALRAEVRHARLPSLPPNRKFKNDATVALQCLLLGHYLQSLVQNPAVRRSAALARFLPRVPFAADSAAPHPAQVRRGRSESGAHVSGIHAAVQRSGSSAAVPSAPAAERPASVRLGGSGAGSGSGGGGGGGAERRKSRRMSLSFGSSAAMPPGLGGSE